MPEATFIICDASAYGRNGDFNGTRWGAMKDAVHLICQRKTEANVENSVGIIAMKYGGPEISMHLTEDQKWSTAWSNIVLSHGRGEIEVDQAIRKARLALKHKRNPKQEKRIVLLVCSPISTPEKPLMKIAKDLKKNGLALDIICFGVPEDHPSKTVQKLEAMVKAVEANNSDNSRFAHCHQGQTIRDLVLSSGIVTGANVGFQPAQQQAEQGAVDNIGGNAQFDPNADPELYAAIQASLAMERDARANEGEGNDDANANSNADAEMEDVSNQNAGDNPQQPPAQSQGDNDQAMPDLGEDSTSNDADDSDEDDNDELLRAIAMSMEEDGEDADELQAAIALSMQEEEVQPANPQQTEVDADQAFLADLMAELPGVSADELDVDAIMTSLQEADKDQSNQNKDEKDESQ